MLQNIYSLMFYTTIERVLILGMGAYHHQTDLICLDFVRFEMEGGQLYAQCNFTDVELDNNDFYISNDCFVLGSP